MIDAETLIPMLSESADRFVISFRDLSPGQFTFREAPDRWSIAETAEHVIAAETGSAKLMAGKLIREAPPPELLAATHDGEHRIDQRLGKRDKYFPAPEFVLPKGRWSTAAEMIEVFTTARNSTIALLRRADLDLSRFAAQHPALGPLNGHQWAYFLVRHALRHIEQIEETKRAADFPRD
jgi:hypothetical protein